MTLRGPAFGELRLRAPKLRALIEDKQQQIVVQTPKGAAAARKLLNALFADTVELTSANDLTLTYQRDAVWVFGTESSSFQSRLKLNAGPASDGLKFRTQEIAFAVLDGPSRAAVADNGEAAAAAALQSAPPLLQFTEPSSLAVCEPGAPPHSAAVQRDVRDLFADVEVEDAAGRTFYALAAGNDASGTLKLGTFAEGSASQVAAVLTPRPGRGCDVRRAAWQRSESTDLSVALRVPMRLELVAKAGASPSFGDLDGLVIKRSAGQTETFIGQLAPTARMRVKTAHGAFEVSPLPSSAPRPGAKARVPAIQIGAQAASGASYQLTHFAAPLALEGADIGLQNSPEAVAALCFDEAECLFYVDGLARLRPRGKSPAQGANPPRGEALIDLGAPRATGAPVSLSLDRAYLSLRRARDLLSLDYRFRDLILEGRPSATGRLDWRVTPDRAMAAFRRERARVAAPVVPPEVCKEPDQRAARAALEEPRDTRPLMVVEFPPQHVAEQAYFRQIQADPTLPLPPKGAEPQESNREMLQFGSLKERLELRNALLNKQKEPSTDPEEQKQRVDFNAFAAAFKKEVSDKDQLPDDQKIYIGPAFLDPQAARIARRVARRLAMQLQQADSVKSDVEYRLRALPDVDLPQDVLDTIPNPKKIDRKVLANWAPGVATKEDPAAIEAYVRARESLKDSHDYDYAQFRAFYFGGDPFEKPPEDAQLDKIYLGRIAAVQGVKLKAPADQEPKLQWYDKLLAAWQKADAQDEALTNTPAEARISGRSRLAFRIPANDYDTGEKDADDRPAGSFPFSVKGLTDWGAYDLAVVRRAEKVFEPSPNGRELQRWNRVESLDDVEKLQHQGITRGDRWSIAKDEGRDCLLPFVRPGMVTSAQRIAEVVASAQAAPAWDETSIEFPFRLMLSPAQDAAWLTPLPVPHPGLARDISLPTPLWSARLDEPAGASSLRSVWSPDFRPEALVDRLLGGPPRGPWAPWALSRDATERDPMTGLEKFRGVMDSYDRHELVILSSLHGLPVRGRRSLDGTLADASQFEPPPGFRLRDAAFESLSETPFDGKPDTTIGDHSAIYRPKPLVASELTLTALGGSLEADSDFEPPAAAKIVSTAAILRHRLPSPPVDHDAVNLFDALTIERWRHSAVLGRDTRVEIVYKGFLFPIGIRASLVKLSERRFLRRKIGGAPVAALVQRLFLRIGRPEKTYPATLQPDAGRSWPLELLEVLTRVTPDLLDPTDAQIGSITEVLETPRGRIVFPDPAGGVLPGLVFWPRVTLGVGGEVQFELQLDKRGARVRLPLIFLDNAAANDKQTVAALVVYYNGLLPQDDSGSAPASWLWSGEGTARDERRRLMDHQGAKRRYAPESQPDDTSFETIFWEVQAEGTATAQARREFVDNDPHYVIQNDTFDFSPILQGADQPPFFPVVRRALVHIGQIDRLVGATSKPVTVRFDPQYQAFGFPRAEVLKGQGTPPGAREASNDVYIDFEEQLRFGPGAAGDRTGGATRPSSDFVALSRSRGPLGGDVVAGVEQAASTSGAPQPLPATSTQLAKPDIGKLFNLDAKILGILSFKDALAIIGDGIASTPAFNEITQYGSALLNDASATGSEAIAKIRDFLLLPLRSALDSLIAEFGASLGGAGKAADQARLALLRLYPEVGAAYGDLHDALDAAIDASTSVADVGSLLGHFAAIYATGRRFLTAIERVARDPVSPVKQAVKDAFSSQVNALLGDVDKTIKDQITQPLKDLAKQAADAVRDILTTEALAVWRHFVFSLPMPVNAATAAPFRQATARALEAALRQDAWINSLQKQRYDEAASIIADTFTRSLHEELADDPTVKAALDDWETAAVSFETRIEGALFLPVMTALSDVFATVQTIGENFQAPDLETIGLRISTVASSLVELAVPKLQKLENGIADQVCTPAMTLFKEFVELVAPRAEGIADASLATFDAAVKETDMAFDALDSALDDLIAGLPDVPRTPVPGEANPVKGELQKLQANAVAYRNTVDDSAQKARRVVTIVGAAAEQFFEDADDFAANACKWSSASDLVGKPIEALSSLAGTRQKLAAVLQDLVSKLSLTPLGSGKDVLAIAFGITTDETLKSSLTHDEKAALSALRTAIGKAAALAAIAGRLAREATALKIDSRKKPDAKSISAQFADLTQKAGQLASTVQSTGGMSAVVDQSILQPIKDLESATIGLQKDVTATINSLDGVTRDATATLATIKQFDDSVSDLNSAAALLATEVGKIISDLIVKFELALTQSLAAAIATSEATREAILARAFTMFAPAIRALALVQKQIVDVRNGVYKQLDPGFSGFVADPQDLASIGAGLGAGIAGNLRRAFLIARPSSVRQDKPPASPEKPAPDDESNDFLAGESWELNYLASALKGGALSPTDSSLAAAIFADWKGGRASVLLLKDQIQGLGQIILSGQLSRIVDLESIRRQVEAKLKEMVPSRVALSYDLNVRMMPVADIFLPQPGSQLTLSAAASYDLLDTSVPPRFTALATLDPFDINLFDVVTFKFDGARFDNDSAKGSHFNVAYNDFVLGSKAEFLKPLQKVLNPEGSGPYVVAARGFPGIEAGFSLALGVIAIGSLSFANVSINAACRLPFDNRQAVFVVSIGRRDKPFLISCLPYTGGGYLALLATSKKMIGFEASFEFGGGGAFKAGPLEGQGRVTLGIFVSQVESIDPDGPQGCTIEGFFYAGGEAHIACFSLSASLSVRISQQPGGSMHGSAIFSFSFSLGIADIHYQIAFIKTEGKGFSGSKANAQLRSRTRYATLAPAYEVRKPNGAILKSQTVSMATDWRAYRRYFAVDIDGFPT